MYKSYIQIERVCGRKHVPVHEFGRRTPAQNEIEMIKKSQDFGEQLSGCVAKTICLCMNLAAAHPLEIGWE